MEEIWKDIPDYNGMYKISNLGRLKSFKNKKEIIKVDYKNRKNGYNYCFLYKNSKVKSIQTHRLVAMLFLNNPNEYPCVNHKDEDKNNNCVNNLEWCSYRYNLNYGYRGKKYSRKINQYDLNDNFIKTWDSIKQTKQAGYTHAVDCCNGTRKVCGNYKWKFSIGE